MIRLEPLAQPESVQEPSFKHPVTRWADVAAFHAAPVRQDGVHVIGDGPAQQIEMLIGGSPFDAADGPVLVIFSGAVTEREQKVPPFFSGSGLAATTGRPFIAISDPGIELNSSLAIAWYAGSSHFDTQSRIVDLLGPVSQRLGRELWLVGGSAGGFAALLYGHLLPGRPSVFVWNPQTDILEYSRRFVVDYLVSAFPVSQNELAGDDYKGVARAVFRHFGRRHSVRDHLPSQSPARLVYIQNATDSHFQDHCLPYLQGNGYSRYDRGVWRRDRDHVVWIADIAPGHTPPSRDQLIRLLGHFTSSDLDVLASVRQFDDLSYFRDAREERPEDLRALAAQLEDRIHVHWTGGEVRVTSDLSEGFGGITWQAERVRSGARSPRHAAWGSWAVEAAEPEAYDVVVRDGFQHEILRFTGG